MKKISLSFLKKHLPHLRRNVFLKRYTTFKIGGPAKYFFEIRSLASLKNAFEIINTFNLDFFVLGKGSNILVGDRGFGGIVLKINNNVFEIKKKGKKIGLRVGAGYSLTKLAIDLSVMGISGFEWAGGIPGTIGGAIYGNAGAFSSSVAEILEQVMVFDYKKGKLFSFSNKDCRFSYRESIFKKKRNFVIWEAYFSLEKKEKQQTMKKLKQYLYYRQQHQPLNYPSAGSVFKNPIFKLKKIKKRWREKIIKDIEQGRLVIKNNFLPAGYIIEKLGLKGKVLGGAKISEKHANFIINFKKAKAKDIVGLIKLIKKRAKEEMGISLEEEIQFLGIDTKL